MPTAKRRSREVDQLYTVAQGCLQKHALDESLEHHNNVVHINQSTDHVMGNALMHLIVLMLR